MRKFILVAGFFICVVTGCGPKSPTAGSLVEAARRLEKTNASVENVISTLGEPSYLSTNQNGEMIVFQYFLAFDKKEKWEGQTCGGVSIVTTNGKIKQVLPIFSN